VSLKKVCILMRGAPGTFKSAIW